MFLSMGAFVTIIACAEKRVNEKGVETLLKSTILSMFGIIRLLLSFKGVSRIGADPYGSFYVADLLASRENV